MISADMGAKIPGVRITPSKTNWVATPQGMPTKRAIADAPSGLPYSRIVDVRVCYSQEYRSVGFGRRVGDEWRRRRVRKGGWNNRGKEINCQ